MSDADTDAQRVEQSILDQFRNIEYIGPQTRLRGGIASYRGRKLGLFLSPGQG